jgi:hypothetical protein
MVDIRDPRFGGNMERANVGAQYAGASRDFYGGPSKGSPMLDQRYENYRAPYSPEYSPSRNPHHPSHANRTEHRDPRYAGYFERNMRGKDRYNIDVGPRPSRDTTGLGGLINRLDTGHVGYTDFLNAVTPDWLPGKYFNQEYKDWNDRFGDDYMISGHPFLSQDNISSERQPGLEGGMGGGLQQTTGLWQDWKRIFNRTGSEDLANQWVESQQVAYNVGDTYPLEGKGGYGTRGPFTIAPHDIQELETIPLDMQFDQWGNPIGGDDYGYFDDTFAARGGLMSLRR